ncbi:hypothetical protein Hanom_Chr08g00746551 [Helianthus anomalus]
MQEDNDKDEDDALHRDWNSPKQMGDCMHEGGSKEAIQTTRTT